MVSRRPTAKFFPGALSEKEFNGSYNLVPCHSNSIACTATGLYVQLQNTVSIITDVACERTENAVLSEIDATSQTSRPKYYIYQTEIS